ncbi:MAG TPA: GNAT family N-acetyltransferase [Burkholderiales bacterium]|nr:GNAT family N-acetyltransferase [Burkholderiales bacterium]
MKEDTPRIEIHDALAGIPRDAWNALAGGHPFLRHELLHAMEETRCVDEASGWAPCHLALWQADALVGAMPLYRKTHSYGEYVFDWAWADAYHRHGLDYYPKLVAAVPFSPVTGPRLLARDRATRSLLVRAALQLATSASSLHVLFAPEAEAGELAAHGMMLRRSVQFHWVNRGYGTFEHFLSELASAKRKKIRQERRRVADAGVSLRRLVGQEIRDEHWAFFARCYNRTYRAHRSTPYLNLDFFRRLGAALPRHVLLVLAERDGQPIASALNLFSDTTLWGRYWGCVAEVPMLHFETCYYQALEFCIERGIGVFEGGAQGEHKLARGFLPVQTASAHWLKHPGFADAVEKFLERESAGVERYVDELNEHSPFRAEGADEPT